MNDLVMTVAEAGKKLRISRGLIYHAINTGQIPSIRIGRRILVPTAALERLVNQTRPEGGNN